jgi:hypothetical protein
MKRAFLMALASSLWYLAAVPVERRGEILPFGVINLESNSTSL